MADETTRPWHGTDNPFEALYQHFTAVIAKLRGGEADRSEAVSEPTFPSRSDPLALPPTTPYPEPVASSGAAPIENVYITPPPVVDATADVPVDGELPLAPQPVVAPDPAAQP